MSAGHTHPRAREGLQGWAGLCEVTTEVSKARRRALSTAPGLTSDPWLGHAGVRWAQGSGQPTGLPCRPFPPGPPRDPNPGPGGHPTTDPPPVQGTTERALACLHPRPSDREPCTLPAQPRGGRAGAARAAAWTHLEERGGVEQGPVPAQADDEIDLVGNVVVV